MASYWACSSQSLAFLLAVGQLEEQGAEISLLEIMENGCFALFAGSQRTQHSHFSFIPTTKFQLCVAQIDHSEQTAIGRNVPSVVPFFIAVVVFCSVLPLLPELWEFPYYFLYFLGFWDAVSLCHFRCIFLLMSFIFCCLIYIITQYH